MRDLLVSLSHLFAVTAVTTFRVVLCALTCGYDDYNDEDEVLEWVRVCLCPPYV